MARRLGTVETVRTKTRSTPPASALSSMVSRTKRSTELRFVGFDYVDEQSRFLWQSMKMLEFPVLVPHRPGRRGLGHKEESIRAEHHLDADIPIVFWRWSWATSAISTSSRAWK